MPDRTFSEEEVADLLRRAAELQAQSTSARPLAGPEKPGLSLDELVTIAADAGLDPEYLRVAAAELVSGRKRRAEVRVTSREITADRWVAGHLSDDAREDIVAELRHRYDTAYGASMGMGSYGGSTVQTLGRSIEWQHVNPWWGTQTRVLIQPRDEGVRVRVTQNNAYSGTATSWSAIYGPMMALAAGFIAGPASGSIWIGIAVAVLALAILTPLTAMLSRRAVERHRREVEDLADVIASHVTPLRQPAGATGSRSAGRAEEPHRPETILDIPEHEEDEAPVRQGKRLRGM